jgi:histidine triad (HIT) family protein
MRARWGARARRLAGTRIGGALLSMVLHHMPFVLPVQRLRETESLIAFHHPTPSHRLHILLLPKQAYRCLTDVPADSGFLIDLLETIKSLVREFDLDITGYRLIVNGGAYQDVPHLHFHLVADEPSLEWSSASDPKRD